MAEETTDATVPGLDPGQDAPAGTELLLELRDVLPDLLLVDDPVAARAVQDEMSDPHDALRQCARNLSIRAVLAVYEVDGSCLLHIKLEAEDFRQPSSWPSCLGAPLRLAEQEEVVVQTIYQHTGLLV